MRVIHLYESVSSHRRMCDGQEYDMPPIQLLAPVAVCVQCYVKTFKKSLEFLKG